MHSPARGPAVRNRGRECLVLRDRAATSEGDAFLGPVPPRIACPFPALVLHWYYLTRFEGDTFSTPVSLDRLLPTRLPGEEGRHECPACGSTSSAPHGSSSTARNSTFPAARRPPCWPTLPSPHRSTSATPWQPCSGRATISPAPDPSCDGHSRSSTVHWGQDGWRRTARRPASMRPPRCGPMCAPSGIAWHRTRRTIIPGTGAVPTACPSFRRQQTSTAAISSPGSRCPTAPHSMSGSAS